MKKILLVCIVSVCAGKIFAQNVGIGTATPNANAQLDVSATNKGLLVPRVDLVALTGNSLSSFGISATPVTSLLVYNTTASTLPSTVFQTGFYYWDGAGNWTKLNTGATSSAATGWGLTGNSGTTASSFIGTTDNNDIFFKRNNAHSGRINSAAANTSFGLGALLLGTTGAANTAFGAYNLQANTSGYGNTSVGTYALATNNQGYNNSALGYNTLVNNSNGNNNSALGTDALLSNTIGNNNTANGFRTLNKNTIGKENAALGDFALYQNTIGNGNVAVGSSANENNTTGFSNVAIGHFALLSNTTGSNLVAIGDSALYNNNQTITFPGFVSGSENVAIGSKALYANTAGRNNTALGYNALMIADANDNLAIGHKAMSNAIGSANTAIGNIALQNTSGVFNTALGSSALSANTAGGYNTSVGVGGLTNNTIGSRNTSLGFGANVRDTNFINATAIGALARVDCSNCLVLGSKNTINGATSDVNVGIGITLPTAKLHIKNEVGGFGLKLESGTLDNYLGFYNSAGYIGYAGTFNALNALDFGTSGAGTDVNIVTGASPKMTVKNNGRVGIGTNAPTAVLDIRTISNPSLPQLNLYDNNAIGYSRLQFQNASGSNFWQIAAYNTAVNANELLNFYNSTSGNVMSITGDGKVGIGTTNPGAFRLAVNGFIRAKEIRVNTGWADYVFEDDYVLKPLAEVESFIKANKHLPDMPAAEQLQKDGVDISAMQTKMMAKIEELTLHLIEANKKIIALEQKISQIQK